MIDIERFGNPDGHEASMIISRLRTMLHHLDKEKIDIILYSNKDDYNRYLKENFSHYPLWICSFTVPENGMEWVMWQYSHRGNVDGVNGKVDLNTIKTDFTVLYKNRPRIKGLSAAHRQEQTTKCPPPQHI